MVIKDRRVKEVKSSINGFDAKKFNDKKRFIEEMKISGDDISVPYLLKPSEAKTVMAKTMAMNQQCCIDAYYCADSKKFHLLFEDLSLSHQTYNLGNSVAHQFNQIALCLAKLHSDSWNSIKETKWPQKIDKDLYFNEFNVMQSFFR